MTEPRLEHELGKPGWMDWLSRKIARVVYRAPRFAPSRFQQRRLMRRRQWVELNGDPFEAMTKDGVRLHAMRFAARQKPDEHEDSKATGTPLPIVFAHGWTEIKEYHHRLARLLTTNGHEFVIFDQRAHGQSKAKCTTMSVRESDDLQAVITAAIDRGFLGERFILMGVSMGGATVLRHAARDPRVAGVVAYAPFASFIDANRTFKQRIFRFATNDWVARGATQAAKQWGFDIREANPSECVANINAPILYIVGDADVHLPTEHHAQMLASITGSDVVLVPGANHFNICYTPWEVADEAMLRFVSNVSTNHAEL